MKNLIFAVTLGLTTTSIFAATPPAHEGDVKPKDKVTQQCEGQAKKQKLDAEKMVDFMKTCIAKHEKKSLK